MTSTAGEEQPQEQPPSPHQEVEVVEAAGVRGTAERDEDGYQQLDTNSNPDVVYEELNSSSEELGNFNRQSVVRRSIRSDSARNIHFTRQRNSRMSIQSESGIIIQVHDQGDHEREGEERASRFSRQRSENMSTRSERGRGVMRRESTEPLFNFQIITSSGGFENPEQPGMQPLSIHQVRTASRQRSKSSDYPLSDIPGFKDPEIMGESDSLEKLKINLPPDIYSSQILSTVRSPEQAGEDGGNANGDGDDMDAEFELSTGARGMVITQRKQSKQLSDNLISLEPGETTSYKMATLL